MPATITNQSLGDSISREFGVHLAGGHMADPPPIDNVLTTTGPKHKPSALTANDTAERQQEEKRLLIEQPRDAASGAVVNAKKPVKRRRRAPATLTVLSTNNDQAALLRAITEATGRQVMNDARRVVAPRPTTTAEAPDATVNFASSTLPATIVEERGQIAAVLAMGETSLQLSVSELALLSIAYAPGARRFDSTRSFASWMLTRQVAQLSALGGADPSVSASSSSAPHVALRVDAGRSSVAAPIPARSETKAAAAADERPSSPSARLVLTSSPLRPSAAAAVGGDTSELSLFPSPVVIPVTPQSPPALDAALNLPTDADLDADINITSAADAHRKHARRASRHHSQRVSLAT